jgi:hypothetical protein
LNFSKFSRVVFYNTRGIAYDVMGAVGFASLLQGFHKAAIKQNYTADQKSKYDNDSFR